MDFLARVEFGEIFQNALVDLLDIRLYLCGDLVDLGLQEHHQLILVVGVFIFDVDKVGAVAALLLEHAKELLVELIYLLCLVLLFLAELLNFFLHNIRVVKVFLVIVLVFLGQMFIR